MNKVATRSGLPLVVKTAFLWLADTKYSNIIERTRLTVVFELRAETSRIPAVSPAATRLDNHVLVVFDDNLVVAVDVQHRDRTHPGRDAARPGHQGRVDGVDQRLHDGVVGGVQIVGHVIRTLARAVERLVAGRRHDPVVPADLAEVDVQRPATTAEVAPLALSGRAPSDAAVLVRRRPLAVPATSKAAAMASLVADVGRD